MTNRSVSTGFLSSRLKIVLAIIVIILLMLVAFSSAKSGSVPLLRDFSLRVVARVIRAELSTPSALLLDIDNACNGNPELAYVRETDVDVEVMVSADSHPFSGGSDDCGAIVEVQLQKPLGDRVLIDKHSGQTLRVDVPDSVGIAIQLSDEEGNLLELAVPASHYAIQRSPEVREAVTSFDHESNRLISIVILETNISDSILDELKDRAANAVAGTVGFNFLNKIEIEIILSERPFLLGLE